MRSKAGMKFDCILEEALDFIEIDYTHLNKTIRYEQRPHGEWKKDGFFAICSECGHELQHYELVVSRLNFCPNCGADMREGEQND